MSAKSVCTHFENLVEELILALCEITIQNVDVQGHRIESTADDPPFDIYYTQPLAWSVQCTQTHEKCAFMHSPIIPQPCKL